jgi:hypothetical protein
MASQKASPYRKHESLPSRREPPLELIYHPSGSDLQIAPVRRVLRTAFLAAPIAIGLALFGAPTSSTFVMGGAIVFAVWRWRQSADVTGIRLRYEDDQLLITFGRSDVPLRVPLRHLRNVQLDSKTIAKVSREVRPDGVMSMSGRPMVVDVSRVVLVLADPEDPLRLTEDYVSHSECLEWLGKIRLFLRLHGWVPEDERARPGES